MRLSAFLILHKQTPGGVETDLEYPGYLFGVSTVHVCLSDGPHMEEFAVWGKKWVYVSLLGCELSKDPLIQYYFGYLSHSTI